MKALSNTIRGWLLDNNYEDIAELIDEIIVEWKKNGNKQRRNWWDILAGDKNGQSRIIAGRKIPVLKAAQIRKKVPITKNAIQRSKKEKTIPVRENSRWKSK